MSAQVHAGPLRSDRAARSSTDGGGSTSSLCISFFILAVCAADSCMTRARELSEESGRSTWKVMFIHGGGVEQRLRSSEDATHRGGRRGTDKDEITKERTVRMRRLHSQICAFPLDLPRLRGMLRGRPTLRAISTSQPAGSIRSSQYCGLVCQSLPLCLLPDVVPEAIWPRRRPDQRAPVRARDEQRSRAAATCMACRACL